MHVEFVGSAVFEIEEIGFGELEEEERREGGMGEERKGEGVAKEGETMKSAKMAKERRREELTWYRLRERRILTRLNRTAGLSGASTHALSYISSASFRRPNFSSTC